MKLPTLSEMSWRDAGNEARLLLIGTYRPVDVIGSQHPLEHVRLELHTRGCSQELSLEPLSEATT